MKAQGSGKRRTPQSAFDPAAGEDVYEPELIVAERLAKGVTQYHVKCGYQVGGVRDEAEHVGAARVPRDTDLDLLVWWKLKETKWPTLAKLVKQHLRRRRPRRRASSASSRRPARCMSHDELRKSMSGSMLKHSLFAAFNTD